MTPALRGFSCRALRYAAVWAGAITASSCGGLTDVPTPSGGVASVAVTPSTITLQVGQQQPVQAVVTDVDGKPMGGATVVWSVRDAAIASVLNVGVVTALEVGQTQIAANVNGKSGIATLTVQRSPISSVAVLPSHVDAF